MVVKVLLVGAAPSDLDSIAGLVTTYLTELEELSVVQVNSIRPTYPVDIINPIVAFADLKDAINGSSRKNDVILSKGSIWEEVAELEFALTSGIISDSEVLVRRAHGLIVLEEILASDVEYWDLIAYKPTEHESVLDSCYDVLYSKFRVINLPILGPFVKLPPDLDEAVDKTVSEIKSFMGLDDE